MITHADLKWVAGFLEGEGCIQAPPAQLGVTANQVQRPLEELRRLLGGTISLIYAR